MHTLRSRILERYDNLTAHFQRLADFLLKSPAEIPLLSSAALGRRVGVSNATVVRFAQMLGYGGYPEMKGEALRELRDGLKPEERFKLAGRRGDENTLHRVAKLDVDNINRTIGDLPSENFNAVVERLCKARRVLLVGVGLSASLARLTAYLLQQVGVDAVSSDAEVTPLEEKVLRLGPQDLVVGFSFPPYSRLTLDIADLARCEGVPLLAVTDRAASPLARMSDVSLVISNENILFTNSFAAFSVVINAVVTEIALRHRRRLIRENERIIKRLKRFYQE